MDIEEDPSLPHKHTCLWMIFWWFSPRYMIIMYHLFPQVYELLADNDDNSDPVFLHSHLQDCFPPVHSQDWFGIPVLPRSWTMISKCSFQDLRILRNTVYRNSDSVEIGAQNTLPNQKTAGHSIKLTWWQNPDLHSHTIDCNEDIAAITLADKSLHIIYMYVNGTEWKSSQVKEMLKKPCKSA